MREPGTARHEDVLQTFYTLSVLLTFCLSLTWGVHALYLVNAGLTLQDLFWVTAFYSASVAAFEIPSGVVADIFGRRFSFMLSLSALAAGSLLFAAAGVSKAGPASFAGASLVMGLGCALYSGAFEAWAVDALRDSGNPYPLETIFADNSFYCGAALLVGSILGGLTATLHMTLPYVLRIALLIVSLRIAYRKVIDSGFVAKASGLREFPGEVRKAVRASLYFGWQEHQARWLLVAAAVQASFLAWGYHAWQPYLMGLLGETAPWISGWIAAAVSLAVMFGNSLVARVYRTCSKRTTLLIYAAAVLGVSLIGVGVSSFFLPALVFYLTAMSALGVYWPVASAYLHEVTPAQYRATVLSSYAAASSGASSMGLGGMGSMMSRYPLDFGYVIGGFVSMAAIPALLMLRRLEAKGDRMQESDSRRIVPQTSRIDRL